jgi:iduronate 2-sulfatase
MENYSLKPFTLVPSLVMPFLLLSAIGMPPEKAMKSQEDSRPNILFIAVDDLKPELGCYGNQLIKTPHIDRLAERGTLFMNNFCQQAVCGPTRASLMTGMRPDYTRVWDLKTRMRDVNPDILSLPQYLISQGYSTQGIGKIYDQRCVDGELDKPSWSVPYHSASADYYPAELGRPALGRYQLPEIKKLVAQFSQEADSKGLKGQDASDYVQLRIKPSVECADVPDHAYGDGANVLKAKEILKELSQQDNPFFFAVGFSKPHLPFVAPKKYWDLYERGELPLSSFREHATGSPDFAYHQSGELRGYTDIPDVVSYSANERRIGLTEEKQRELIHGYYAAVSYVDAQVGILLDALDALGLADNTLVILWGDHGWHLGDHDLWCKHSNFEQATKTPMVISAPGIPSGKTSSVTEFVDIFPTLCELAGVPLPKHLQGKSLAGIMKDPSQSVKEFAVSQYPRQLNKAEMTAKNLSGTQAADMMGYSIRDGRYRYTLWLKEGYRSYQPYREELVVASELYDYQEDPLEKVNVATDMKYAGVAKEMHRKMRDFFKQQGEVQ